MIPSGNHERTDQLKALKWILCKEKWDDTNITYFFFTRILKSDSYILFRHKDVFCCLPERSIHQTNILVLEYFSTVQTFYFLYVYRINCTISHKFLAYILLSASFCKTYLITVMHIHGRFFFRHSKKILQVISLLLMKGHGQGVLII